MSHSLEVTTWRDRPVVVKTAIDEPGRHRLIRERKRFEAMRHPGVVDLLEVGDDPVSLTCAWAGGRSLETHRPALGPSVALLAAVAATLADLHAVGLVHGRIEASHVVVDADGRPRLCGVAGVEPGEPTPVPADDVAGLGRLIELLIGSGSEPEPIPEWRWGRRRWTGYQRRALQTMADQAADPDPDRRPTARDLAHAFVEVVPDARLAPVSHLVGTHPGPVGSARPAGSAGSAESDASVASAEPEGSVDGTGPKVEYEEGSGREATEDGGEGGSSDLFEWVDHEGWDLGDGWPSPNSVGQEDLEGAEHTSDPPSGPQPVDEFLGMRLAEQRPLDGAPVGARRVEAADEAAPQHRPRRPPASGDGSGRRHGAHSRRGRGTLVLLVVAVILVVGLALSGFVGRSAKPSQVARRTQPLTPRTHDGETTTPAPAPAPARAPGLGNRGPCPTVSAPAADVDGDGCAEGVVIDGSSIQAGPVKYRLGEASDRLAVGDWDCDGLATPALVRPGTGEVFVFARWATATEPLTLAPTAVVAAGATPVSDRPSRCGPLLLRTGQGATTTVTATGQVDR